MSFSCLVDGLAVVEEVCGVDTLKPLFDRWSFYDNSVDGRSPQLIDEKE